MKFAAFTVYVGDETQGRVRYINPDYVVGISDYGDHCGIDTADGKSFEAVGTVSQVVNSLQGK